MIQFSTPLIKGKLLKREKRFLAHVLLEDGQEVIGHCPNTGSMKTCADPESSVYLLYDPNPKRKLHYTWEYTEIPEGFIGINTQRPNRIVEEAIREQKVPELTGYQKIRREVKYGENSKIDLLLEAPTSPPCYVEIKNVTLKVNDGLAFPDAITKRGQKHLLELTELALKGTRAVMFFLCNRPDGDRFRAAYEIDPDYSLLLKKAYHAGVEILCYRVKASLTGMELGDKVEVQID